MMKRQGFGFISRIEEKNGVTLFPEVVPEYGLIRWVMLARLKDESRHFLRFLQFLHAKDGWIEATDGRRLHRIVFHPETSSHELRLLGDGIYEEVPGKKGVVFRKIAQEGFPDTSRVFSSLKAEAACDIVCGKSTGGVFTDSQLLSSNYTEVIRMIGKGETIDLKYFEDIQKFDGKVKVEYFGPGIPVKFTSEGMIAVIMPMTFRNKAGERIL